ncbi:hypothetical protein KP626_00555 [Christensenella sp. MSJ-20]|uniref:hypothetical protein n=1 Tax=Christensenella sp. MSJ-20 TaxID=2841518 RepID=UPI001C7500D9|nr:hypothetical protein KP626_00555 [Christensenella sp. MSJ-20]
MEKLNRFVMATAKVLEVLHWLGILAAIALFILSFVAKDWATGLVALSDGELQFYGFSIGVLTPAGGVSFGAVRAFAVAGFFFCSLMGMVFRNIYLILRTAKGKTWFAKGDTPFQNDIVRMVREIGIFHIGVPVLGLFISWIARLVLGAESLETSMSLGGFITGIVVLCLSQIFAYGIELQRDVDGLV